MAPGKRTARVTPAQAKQDLIAALERTLELLERAHADAAEGATHEEAKPEDDKDTRALEQSYLARGQAQRAGGKGGR